MKVELLYHTPNPELACATAARQCYSPQDAADLYHTMDEYHIHRVLSTIMGSGHYSTLEHASYTFAISGVSRSLTHQLVRHRMASFEQQSQRYVTFHHGVPFVTPPTIAKNPATKKIYDQALQNAAKAYSELVEAGIPAEDARYLLPNATETKIVVTMNIRELLHFFTLRCCNRAQWEIRELAHQMLELARPTAPFIFMDAGASCVHDCCHEGKMTCGHPYPHVDRAKKTQEILAQDKKSHEVAQKN